MFYDNLQTICRENNTTVARMVKALGFSTGMPTSWKRGSIPKADTLQKIADYFHVTTDALLNGPNPPAKLSHEEGVRVAVLSTVGAGIPLEAINVFDQDDPESWEEIGRLDAKQGPHFALRIRGNSMEPYIRHGDIVIVRIQETYEDGDIVVALVNGDEGLCKLLEYRNNGIALLSLNPEFPPMTYTREQIENLPVRIMGRCIEVRHRIGKGAY